MRSAVNRDYGSSNLGRAVFNKEGKMRKNYDEIFALTMGFIFLVICVIKGFQGYPVLFAFPLAIGLVCLLNYLNHKDDNLCTKCGKRITNITTSGFVMRGNNYECSCGNKWRILEDY